MDEQLAFRPFEDLALLMTRPAHLATFIHYLFSNCLVEDDMVLTMIEESYAQVIRCSQAFFLATEWFQLNPTREQAQKIFDDFVSSQSVCADES